MDKKRLTETEASDFTGLSKANLQKRRFLGQPPRYFKLGKSVRYDVQDLEQWLAASRVEPVEQQ
jgi:predicted DNA-binding transcriptional regulator AlpA